MIQISLHLLTIRRATLGTRASGSMLQQLYMQLNIPLPFLPLLRRQLTRLTLIIPPVHRYRLELVVARPTIRLGVVKALAAQIKIGGAYFAVVPHPRQYLAIARPALLHEFGCSAIVQVPEDHHGGVFRSS